VRRLGRDGRTPRFDRWIEVDEPLDVAKARELTEAERAAHETFVATLGDKALWNR